MFTRLFPGAAMHIAHYRQLIETYLFGTTSPVSMATELGTTIPRTWPRWIRPLIALLAVIFYGGMIYYAVKNWDFAVLKEIHFLWYGVALAIVVHVPGRIWAFYIRQITLLKLGYQLPLLEHLRIVTFSDLASKLPGLFWSYISQIYLYRRMSVPRSAIVVLIALEIFMIGVASSLLSLVMVALQPSMQQFLPIPVLVFALIICTGLTHPAILRLILRKLPNPQLQEALSRLTWGAILLLVLSQSFIVVVGGICLFGITGSVVGFSADLPLTTLTIWSFTMVWGIIISWLPVDFGLRQGPLLVMLTALYSPAIVVVIMLIWRVWFNCMELGWGALAIVLAIRKASEARQAEIPTESI
jgi:hypothetical protein